MPWNYNGSTYPDDAVLEIDEMNYHLSRQSPEDLAELGVTRVEPPAAIDEFELQNLGGVVSPRPWEDRKRVLVAYASDQRWVREVGGVDVGGLRVPTDDRAKVMLAAAAGLAADAVVPLIIAGVDYGTRTGAEMRTIYATVVAHVQATMAAMRAVLAGINADPPTITTREAVDAAFDQELG